MKYIKYFEGHGIRDIYSEIGVDNYYSKHRSEYTNPHRETINECLDWVSQKIDIEKFLDLSCGNGEVSSHLNKLGLNDFKGCDPYFSEIYQSNFNKQCYDMRFEDISLRYLPDNFNTIICSYALHLCPKSYFNNLLYALSIGCKYFVVISPSKYPLIDKYFKLVDKTIINRTHCRIYKSIN